MAMYGSGSSSWLSGLPIGPVGEPTRLAGAEGKAQKRTGKNEGEGETEENRRGREEGT